MLQVAISFMLAFATTVALVPLVRLLAFRFGYVAKPRADRWHTKPTALLGGVPVGLVTIAGVLLAGSAGDPRLLVLTACAATIFVVGLVDDLLNLKPATKLVAQIVLASVCVFYGAQLGWVRSQTLDAMLTIAWIVGITNALNLLDNMDGLCGGIGVIACGALLTTLALDGRLASTEAAYLAVLGGAVAGFLVYNVHPASIFMGDAGSLFIGLNLAVLSLQEAHGAGGSSQVLSVLAAPVFTLLIPIFDTTLVTVIRLLSGRRASQGGRDHSSHRLVAIGLSEPRAVAVLWVLAILASGTGVALERSGGTWSLPSASLFVLAMLLLAVYLARVRVYEEGEFNLLQRGRVTPFIVHFLYKRRVAEVALDFCLVSVAYYLAFRLRFEGQQFGAYFPLFIDSLPVVVAAQLAALFIVGTYRGLWHYYGLMDIVVLARGVALGTLLAVVALLYTVRFYNYSRAVFVIYAALAFLFIAASRASFRLMAEFARRHQPGRRLVVCGVAESAGMVVRELLGRRSPVYRMLGFIDETPGAQRARVQGYPVLGGVESLLALIAGGAVDTIVVASDEFDGATLQRIEAACAEQSVELLRFTIELKPVVLAS